MFRSKDIQNCTAGPMCIIAYCFSLSHVKRCSSLGNVSEISVYSLVYVPLTLFMRLESTASLSKVFHSALRLLHTETKSRLSCVLVNRCAAVLILSILFNSS